MFVGRKEYLDFFEDGRCKIKEECERQLVIQIDGKSGIGKTVLLNELERSFINSKKNNYILINLTEDYINKNSKDILQRMRNQLVNKMDFEFWRYDLAMVQYAHLTGTSLFCSDCTKGNKTGISKWIEEHHLNPLVTEAVDLLLQANNPVSSITNIAAKVIALAKDIKEERFLKAIKDSEELDNKTAYEIKGKLYEYFGQDLEDNLNNNKDFPLTIFIDAYEEMNTDSYQNNTEWLMGTKGIIKYTQNHDVTWVIAGKEKCIIHRNVIFKKFSDNEKDFDQRSVREQSYTLDPLKKQEIEEILKSEEIPAVFYEKIYDDYMKKPENLSKVLLHAERSKEFGVPFNMNIEDENPPICQKKLDCTNLLYQLAYLGRWNNVFIKDIIDNFNQYEYDKLKKSEKKYFKDILGGKESSFNEALRETISTKYIKTEKNREEIETLKQNFQKKYFTILENPKVNEEYISAIITLVQFYGNHKEIVCPIDKLMDGISMLIKEDEIEAALYSIKKLNGSFHNIQKFHDVKIMLYEKEKEVLGESNPITIRIKDELTRDEKFVGCSEKEYESRKKKYQKLKEDLGEDHLETISYSETLVNSFFHLNRFEDAYELRKKIYGQLKAEPMRGENHAKTVDCKSSMVHLLEDLKRYEKACELAQEIYEQRKATQGENDIETIKSKENWALALKKNGSYEIDDETRQEIYEKVYQMHMEIYNQRKKILGETHKDTRTSIYYMGTSLMDLRRYEEACEMCKKQYEILVEVEGKDARDTIICKRNLLNRLRNIGRDEEAKVLEMS